MKRPNLRVLDDLHRVVARLERLATTTSPSLKQLMEIGQLIGQAADLQGQLADWSEALAVRLDAVLPGLMAMVEPGTAGEVGE